MIIPAKAQTIDPHAPPPLPTILDQNGINLQTGEFQISGPSVSVGQSGQGGMSYTPLSATHAWTNDLLSSITYDPTDPNTLTVTYRNVNSVFYLYTPYSGDGASLSHSGTTYTFTAHDGTVVVFQDVTSTWSCNYYDISCTAGIITSVTLPTGEVLTYTYVTGLIAINSINSSLGYQLKFNYSCSGCYFTVTAVNNAVNYCDPNGTTCPGTWPTMTYTISGTPGSPLTATVTDALGNVTTNAEYWSSTVNYQQTVTQPSGRFIQRTAQNGSTSSDIKEVVTNGSGSWQYEIATPSTPYSVTTTTVTDPQGRVRVVVSDPATGQISSDTQDPSGLNLTTQYAWGSLGVPIQVTYPEGNYVHRNQDLRGNITQVDLVAKPGSGISTISTYATYDTCTSTNRLHCNKPVTATDSNGNVTTYTYDDASGELASATGPAVNGGSPVTTYSYSAKYAWYKNSLGNIVQAAAPVYKPTSASRCLLKGGNWNSVTWGYFTWSASGTCIGTAQEQVTSTSYTVGSSSVATNLLPVSATIAAGDSSISSTTSVTYDSYGNVVSTTGSISGSTSVLFYDLDRRVYGTVSPDPTGSGAYPAVRTTYDVDSRVTEVERGTTPGQSSSNWTSFSALTQEMIGYDTYSGLKNKDTAAIGGTTQSVSQFSYDSTGLALCTAIRETASVFGSLPSDACTQSTSANSDQIAFNSYDNASRLTSTQTGHGTGSPIIAMTNSYTANSKLAWVEDGHSATVMYGNHTAYTYDGLDRLVQMNLPSKTTLGSSSSTDYEHYTYDANGNLTQKRLRTTETITYNYDALNRQTEKHLPGGGSADVYTGYDLAGDLLYAHYGSAGGSGIDYAYDALGRKTSETSYGRTVASQYDAAGDRTRLTFPDGNYVQYSYDVLNRMYQAKENGGTVLAQYAYDSLGRETGITRSNSTATSMSYSGSSTGWSLSQSGTSQNVTFGLSYTPGGQLTQRTISNSAYAYGASSLSNSYSPNGLNQYDSVAGATYSYDGRGNLTSNSVRGLNYNLQNQLTSTSAVSPAVAIAYDPAGRLNQTTVASATEQFLYDGNNLIAEYDSSGNCLRRFVPGQSVDETLVWYEGAGLSNPNWLHTDQQGSVVATTNSSGTATTYTYSATGEPGSWTGPRFRYTGQVAIPELALYYYKARLYDPALGRFLQTDPVGYLDDLNLYAYVGNDPANGSDPSGLDVVDCAPGQAICGVEDPAHPFGSNPFGLLDNCRTCDRFVLVGDLPDFGSNRGAKNGTNQKACPVFTGDATYYNLPGSSTAYGKPFNPNTNNAAMYQPGAIHNGDSVTVTLRNPPGNSVTVIVNDTGPFAREPHGGPALHPLRPDPTDVIDLTPHAFTDLTGSLKAGRVPVTVAKNCNG